MAKWTFVVVAALALLAPGSLLAGQRVVFDDGRGLAITGFEMRDGYAYLTLEGGGSLVVPAARIAGMETVRDIPRLEDALDPAAVVEELGLDERWREVAGPYASLVADAADRYGIDRALLTAVVMVESGFDPFAVSSKGACGLLQLMPATARRFKTRDVFDAGQNIEAGARYLRWLLDRFDGRIDLALAAYNAGEGSVDRYGGIPPYAETQSYVVKVLDHASKNEGPP